jgi:hypothetical protein
VTHGHILLSQIRDSSKLEDHVKYQTINIFISVSFNLKMLGRLISVSEINELFITYEENMKQVHIFSLSTNGM